LEPILVPAASPAHKPSDRALLVLDMHDAWVQGPSAIPGADELLPYIKGELTYFRERSRPVFFAVQTSEESPLVRELTPRPREVVLERDAPSAFYGTDLEAQLKEANVARLTLVGLETCTSVLLTAADALARGFRVTVPDPCVAARNPDDHRAALRLIREVWTPGADASTSGWFTLPQAS
jgi:nicotinamidase-related amidase